MGQRVVQKIGKYEILSELGQGGMGVVYKARDPFIGRLVALKTVTPELVSNPEILKRFYREAQSAGTLQHPNIVTVFDLGEFEGQPYIAMEFVEGESLQSIIARRAELPLAAKLNLAEQVCLGLDHAHKHGIVHRDIKPGNILVKNDGTVKVVDFGIVHVESTTLTQTGMFMGTIQYASPEQLNEGHVDARSDLWSVVCVIYELIAYKKPFEGSNFGAILGKILTGQPEPLSHRCPDVPPELDNIIAKGLKKSVEERYQSLDELLADLAPIGQRLQRSLIGELLVEARQMKEKGDLNSAQAKVRAILMLDRTHGEAKAIESEIAAELHRLSSLPRFRELITEGEQAFNRGAFSDAIRALSGALELNPNDTQARSLKERAGREQERLQQAREAMAAGQSAMKQGDLTGAEVKLQKVLEIDKDNAQASGLLAEIRRDRLARERDFKIKEGLWNADKLISEGKHREAAVELTALQEEFPDAENVQQKLQAVNKHLAETAAPSDMPPEVGKGQWRDAQIIEATRLLAGNEILRATGLLKDVKDQFPADATVDALLREAAQKAPAPATPRVAPVSPAAVGTQMSRRPLGMILSGIALAVALAVGGLLYYQHARPAGKASASSEEMELEHDAKLLQQHGDLNAALGKWRDLAARHGALQSEADQAVAEITHQQDIQKQEDALFGQAKAAQQAKKWDDALALYQKVADLNGPTKDQALLAISSVKELQSGQEASVVEKEKYDQAVAALKQQDYARARTLFQQVVDLNVPNSSFAPKAQSQLETVKSTLQTQQDFQAAEKQQSNGDLNGALARFQGIAAKPGPFQAQAQSRVQQINQVVAANQQKEQTEKGLQDGLRKFQDLERQKKYGDAAAILPTISKMGGDAGQLKNALESAEQSDFTNLTSQFNQARNNQDTASLQELRGQFQNLAAAGGTRAGQARDYAENQIPSAISQIHQADQQKVQPSAPPVAATRAPVVTVTSSGPYRPFSGPLQKGRLVPDYNVDGGLKPVNLALPPVPGAPIGSFVTLKINIDETGAVSPDIVLLDPSGVSSAVMDAAKRWKFNPPTVRGKPVKTSITAKVAF
jgi:TonB family protein